MKRIFSAILLATLLTACGGPQTEQIQQTAPQETSQGQAVPTPAPLQPGQAGFYANNWVLPAVTTVYSMTVEVQAAPGQLQQYSESGKINGSSYQNGGYGSGYVSGSWSGDTSGKGFVRVKVREITIFDPYNNINENQALIVIKGRKLILKTGDSKMSILGAGDVVQVICRQDNEFVRAAAANEIPTLQTLTQELDNCRMLNPFLE